MLSFSLYIAAVIPETEGHPGPIDWNIIERGRLLASRFIKAARFNHPHLLNNGSRIGFAVGDDGRCGGADSRNAQFD